jgi:hypothetical protein
MHVIHLPHIHTGLSGNYSKNTGLCELSVLCVLCCTKLTLVCARVREGAHTRQSRPESSRALSGSCCVSVCLFKVGWVAGVSAVRCEAGSARSVVREVRWPGSAGTEWLVWWSGAGTQGGWAGASLELCESYLDSRDSIECMRRLRKRVWVWAHLTLLTLS